MKIKNILYTVVACLILISLASCATVTGNVYPLSSGYIKHDNLYNELFAISSSSPALAQLRIIGFSSTETLPIYALEIGHIDAPKTALIIGQHHGDEVLGVNVSVAFARQLVSEYAVNDDYKQLLHQYRFWIVPSLNPEGFRIVSSGQFEFKRKNNTDTDANKRLDLRTDGVDLNRNYPVFWDLDPDTNVNSPFYKGKAPVSEKEVEAIVALAQLQNFDIAIFLHSSASGAYSEKLYLPANENDSELFMQTKLLAGAYAHEVRKDYSSGTYEVHEGRTSAVGNARNYFFHRLGTKAFLVEIGGINKRGQSIIHPNDKILSKIVTKHLRAMEKLFLQQIDTRLPIQ